MDRVRAVAFFATPHNGATLANYADAFRRAFRTSVAVAELRANEAELLQLDLTFRNDFTRRSLDVSVFYELLPTNGVKVVDAGSSDPHLDSVVPIGMDTDHNGIIKVQSADDLRAGRLIEMTRRLLPPGNVPASTRMSPIRRMLIAKSSERARATLLEIEEEARANPADLRLQTDARRARELFGVATEAGGLPPPSRPARLIPLAVPATAVGGAIVVGLVAWGVQQGLLSWWHRETPPTYTLAFVVNGHSDFWAAAEAGMKKAQSELPDFKLEFKYPDQSSVANQQSLMDNLATAGVKAIMVSAIDPKAIDVLDAIATKTALFTTDADAPQSKRIAYVGSSNVLAGDQAARIAKQAMPNGGKCVGFVGLLDAANFKEREEGFVEGLLGTDISLVDTKGDEINQARAKANVENVLAANPDVNCMVGFYSYNAPQIYEALKDAGKLGQITVVGFDDDPITLGGVKEGNIAGTVVQQPFEWAYQGFKLMAEYIKGDKSGIPANGQLIVPTKILYAGDIDAYVANLKAVTSNQ